MAVEIYIKSRCMSSKNYLNKDEQDTLNKIVTVYLDIPEAPALNHESIYMKDGLVTIDDYLKMIRRDILKTKGTVTHKLTLKLIMSIKNIENRNQIGYF